MIIYLLIYRWTVDFYSAVATANKNAMNICGQIFQWACFLISYEYPGTEFLSHMISLCLLHMSTLMPIPHCTDWSLVQSLELRKCKLSISFLFKNALDITGFLNFPIHFRITLSISAKKYLLWFPMILHWITDHFGYTYILTMCRLLFCYEQCMLLYLLVSFKDFSKCFESFSVQVWDTFAKFIFHTIVNYWLRYN